MSLYAIGDLHLHYQSVLKAPMQQTGVWRNHEEKVLKYCRKLIHEDDVLLLAGDHSWGHNLSECEKDLQFIEELPGKKVLLRGNHDMFWDAKKTASLNERFEGRLFFLQDNYYPYEDYALVGTKGYVFEGPYYLDGRGRIAGWDEKEKAHADKLIERESIRLRTSFEAAVRDGYKKFIMFLHYPPTDIFKERSVFTDMAEEYRVSQVVYAHCHGERRFNDSLRGEYNGILYRLVSGDCLKWKPEKIL
ncbi:MAG: metallophosphoesterase [Lachnospiraceae bacterium]|nr:metallophosphoesterase [Lachnospiraceae bacterium]